MILDLAKILRAEHLLRADNFRTGFGGLFDEAHLFFQVGIDIKVAFHLGNADVDDAG